MESELNRILIVEDESIAALDLKKTLESEGYTVVGYVSTGEEAINIANKIQPDLILMDIHLQGKVDGIEAAKEINSNLNIPIVYLTAYADQATLKRAKFTFPYGYIIKPYENRNLFSTIEMALYKHAMERKIEESEKRFRMVIQATSDVIWDYDFKKNILWLNENFDLLFGSNPNEKICWENIFEKRIHPDDKDRVINGFRITLKNNKRFWSDEYRFQRFEGSYAYVFNRGQIIYDKYNEPLRCIGSTMDITEQRKSEIALKESKIRYQSFIEQIAEGIWRLEFEQPMAINLPIETQAEYITEKSYIAECNDVLAKMYGYEKASELIGKKPSEFIDRLDPENIGWSRDFIKSGYKLTDCETKETDKFGITRYFLNNYVGIIEKGKLLRLWGTQRDITEKKIAEEQLQISKQQLRDLAARLELIREEDRTHIAREIHDELGQLLTALKMDIAVFNRRILTKKKELTNSEIKSEINSINALIDKSIHTIRKIASELRSEILKDLGINEAIEWHAKEIKNKTGMDFVFISKVNNEEFNEPKSSALFRIFQETITNIIRHAEATKFEIMLEKKDHNIVLSVKDNGKGIRKEELNSRKSIGILGMMERARMLDGSVDIEGIKNEGTIVRVKLPL
jgi:PAS domain S-box-containing protein